GAPGPGGPAIVSTMIEADGGVPGTLQPVNNSFHHTDALAEGKADVATLIFQNFEIVEARERGFDARFFALKDWGIPDFCQLILITTPEILRQREDVMRRLVHVLRRAIDHVRWHPEDAAAVYAERAGTSPDDTISRSLTAATIPRLTHNLQLNCRH